jgi:hypothetical protein
MIFSKLLSSSASSAVYHTAVAFCHAYPAYQTLRAIHTPSAALQEKWMTFWVVHSPLLLMERLPIGMTRLPGYWTMKCVLLLWLTLPRFSGADLIYSRLLQPFLSAHAAMIDSHLALWREKVQLTAERLGARGWTKAREIVAALAVQFAQIVTSQMKSNQAAVGAAASSMLLPAGEKSQQLLLLPPNVPAAAPVFSTSLPVSRIPATEPIFLVLSGAVDRTPIVTTLAESVMQQIEAAAVDKYNEMTAAVEPTEQQQSIATVTPDEETNQDQENSSAPTNIHVQARNRSSRARAALEDATPAAVNISIASATPTNDKVRSRIPQLSPRKLQLHDAI